MPNLNPNSTSYTHSSEPNTSDLTMAMDYNTDGKPALRVLSNIQGDITIDGNVSIPGEVTVVTSDDDPLITHTHIYDENEVEYSATNPFTIDGTVELGSTSLSALENINATVTGTVTANVNGTVSVSNFPATQTVDGTVTIQDGGGSITVDGTVSVDNFPATQTVDGTVNIGTMPDITVDFPATQTVDGTVTIQDGGGSITVDGTVNANISNAEVNLTGTNLDAFARLRVSNPHTLFDSKAINFADSDQFSTSTSGSGTSTYLENESTQEYEVGTDSGAEVVQQTRRRMTYQPGKSLLFMASFVFGAPKTNVRRRIGYFSVENGLFVEQTDAGAFMVLRSSHTGSTVDTRISQANWNGDKLDGTGTSGYTIDFEQSQLMWLDIEWLGVGSVRMGFIINGNFIVSHTFHNANLNDSVYMTSPNKPVRAELTNTGTTASSSTMKRICSTVISEGGYNNRVNLSIARMTSARTNVGTDFEPLISIRLNNTYPDTAVIPHIYHLLPTDGGPYEVAIFKNATLTSPDWDDTQFNRVEVDTDASAMSGGTIVEAGYISASSTDGPGNSGSSVLNASSETDVGYNYSLQLGVELDGTSDIFTLAARTLSGTGDIIGNIGFYDLT